MWYMFSLFWPFGNPVLFKYSSPISGVKLDQNQARMNTEAVTSWKTLLILSYYPSCASQFIRRKRNADRTRNKSIHQSATVINV